MTEGGVDWNRVAKAISQQACVKLESDFIERLKELAGICGKASVNRVMLTRVGALLLKPDAPLVVPICHKYNRSGAHNMLTGNVAPIARAHIEFLAKVQRWFPDVYPIFLYSVQDAEDPMVLQSVGFDVAEFRRRMKKEMEELRRELADTRWRVATMTEIFPDLREREQVLQASVAKDSRFEARITSIAIDRADFFERAHCRSTEEMKRHVVAMAAQYLALSECSIAMGGGIVNHTSTNLAWYREGGATLLHNPVTTA